MPSSPPSPLPSSSTAFAQSCWTHKLLYLLFYFHFSIYMLLTALFSLNKDNLGLTVFGSVCCTRRCEASMTTTLGNVSSIFSGVLFGVDWGDQIGLERNIVESLLCSKGQVGDWFVLYQLCKNCNPYFFRSKKNTSSGDNFADSFTSWFSFHMQSVARKNSYAKKLQK